MASRPSAPETCPAWCVLRHGLRAGEEDLHIGGALLVGRTPLRLCTTIDPETHIEEGPFVLIGDAEHTLHEAELLIAALSQLADQARSSLVAEHPQGALPVPDP